MAEEDKAHWQRTAEADKERYERELAEYEAQDEEEDSDGEPAARRHVAHDGSASRHRSSSSAKSICSLGSFILTGSVC